WPSTTSSASCACASINCCCICCACSSSPPRSKPSLRSGIPGRPGTISGLSLSLTDGHLFGPGERFLQAVFGRGYRRGVLHLAEVDGLVGALRRRLRGCLVLPL